MIRPLFLAIALLLWPLAVDAQQADTAEPAPSEQTEPEPEAEEAAPTTEAAQAEEQAPEIGTSDLPSDEPAWERLASRAEDLARRGDASRFAINRLRAELVSWRDEFLSRTTINAGRIATVEAQIAALGPAPESGEEPPAIADRRAALQSQLDDLTAPRILAEEAHARANGLIGEFDAQILLRETSELTKRGPSPLNPTHLAAAGLALWDVVRVTSSEVVAGFHQQTGDGRLAANFPRAGFFLALAIILLVFARRWVTNWRMRAAQGEGRLLPLWLFVLSLGQIIVPVLGLIAMTAGLETLNVFGLRSGHVVDALPVAGFLVVFAWWLSRHVFPVGQKPGFLGQDAATRAGGRRYGIAIAWVLAVALLFEAALQTIDTAEATRAAMVWPILVLLGVLLWRLGRKIKRLPEPIEGETVSQGRMRSIVGKVCTVVAIVAPVIAAVGYDNAGRALMVPWLVSLALIGVILILQRIVNDLSNTRAKDGAETTGGSLIPVVISFALYLASLPIFALIWGARTDDLLEIWTRFREGFAIGESRISPTDFLTFALVFAVGYLLTRFIQGTLRRSVLPRTRLDLGGQNAIVAGFGYVGIILAAIIAITSAGIDLSNLAIVAGALSVGIGFGLQNIVSNFVSGIILLIERPVSEGDWIEVGGQMGYVRSISVRSTRIETFDRTDVIVPNADLVSGQVTNWTRGNLVGRVIVPVGVAYGSDVDKVTEILRGIAEAHPMVVMTPPPSVLFMGFGADSLDFEIRAILRDVNYVIVTRSEMNHEIAKKFAEAGIEIPFAQRDIWLRNPEALRGEKE